MDSNPIAPFPMYVDEYIVWMEKRNSEKQSLKSYLLIFVMVAFFGLGGIALFYYLYMVNQSYLAVSIIVPFIFLWLPLIIAFIVSYKMHSARFVYYLTNYRLIELIEVKNPTIRFGYLLNLIDTKMVTKYNRELSIEFEWYDEGSSHNLCHGFFNISNAYEIGDIIVEQKQKLLESSINFDFVSQ